MTQSALKLLALAAMLCDHLAKVVLNTGILAPMIGIQANLFLRIFMVSVGRMAFPIFAWFTAEGCRKTGNPKRYLLRLLIFAVVSEIPFQLCFYNAYSTGIKLAFHNVIFTMLLAAGAVFFGKWLAEHRVPEGAAKLIPAAAAIALGWFLHTDYNAWGVALILGLYYLKEENVRLLFLGCWITVFMLVWHGWTGNGLSWLGDENGYQLILQWIGCLFALIFLATYNGQRGRKLKWLFYVFYPVHLTLLFAIRMAILL